MDAATAFRLVEALSIAGLLLLGMEVFLPGNGFKIFGGLALTGAVGVAYYGCGIDTGSVLLLILSTVISLGFLTLLALFPKAPLARRVLRRAAEKAAKEEESSPERQPEK